MRQLEADMRKDDAAQTRDVKREGKGHTSGTKDADTRALEKRLSDALGLEVSVDHRDEGGTLTHQVPRFGAIRRGIKQAKPLTTTTS